MQTILGLNRPNLVDGVSIGGGSVMVRCSIWSGRTVGPCLFSQTTVLGETDRNMLSTYAIPRIGALQRRPIFMHDGALPHIYGRVKELLDQNFEIDWVEMCPRTELILNTFYSSKQSSEISLLNKGNRLNNFYQGFTFRT